MAELWERASLGVFDLLLGWAMRISPDAGLAALVALSAVVLALVRRWTTDQELLRRVAADKARLRERLREARGNAAELRRLKEVRARVLMKAMGQEGGPFLWVLVPLAMLGTWAFARLEFLPPEPGAAVKLRAVLPRSAAGGVAHVVPVEGLSAEGGWVRPVEAAEIDGRPCGTAVWTLRGSGVLTVRVGSETYRVPHDAGVAVVALELAPYRFLGVVPWLIAYVLLVIPAALLARRALRIA